MAAIGRRRLSRGLPLCLSLCLGLLPAGGAGCRRTSLLPRADGAAVVVTATPAATDQDVTFVPEVEPNDMLPAAQKLEFAATAAPLGVTGRLEAPAGKAHDVDLFRLTIPAPPGTGAGAGSADAAGVVVRRRLSVEVTPGVYHLRVRAAGNSAGAYRLVARLAPLETGEEQEPNGKAALASEAPAGGEVVGYHGWRHDQDWYRVPLAAAPDGSVLAVDLEGVPGVAASLLVFDSAERKLLESHGRTEERVAVRNLRLPAGDPQLYVVVRADAGRNATVRYNLRLRLEVPKGGSELEPNDDSAHAQAIADGDTLGFLGRGDVDVYRYTPPPGPAELDIELAPPERVDAKLEVLRATDGMLLARADAGRRHEGERIPNLFSPGGGAFLIRLSAGKSDGNPDEPYRLTVSSRAAEPGAEREPNATAAAATPLPVGVVGTGLVYPRGDVDVWRVPLEGATAAGATVTVTGIAGLTLEVRVQSNDERELGRFKVAGATPTPFTVAPAGAACCLVQIRDASTKIAAPNPRDRYALTVGP